MSRKSEFAGLTQDRVEVLIHTVSGIKTEIRTVYREAYGREISEERMAEFLGEVLEPAITQMIAQRINEIWEPQVLGTIPAAHQDDDDE